MPSDQARHERHLSQLRLLLEELCCDLCLFEHVVEDGVAPDGVSIDREFVLGPPGAFADIRVAPAQKAPYFVEVKHGYSVERLEAHLRRKYGRAGRLMQGVQRLVVVMEGVQSEGLQERLQGSVQPQMGVEIWDEPLLMDLLQKRFGVKLKGITEGDLLEVREAVDRAKGFHAFGGAAPESYRNEPLHAELLWHFDFWRLRQLRESRGLSAGQILPAGPYQGVAVVLADLCAFSSYVHDTQEDDLIRHCLTSFYSKARYQIIKKGGMLYQFIGDCVIGLFGVPDQQPGYLQSALAAAEGLISIGTSVSHHWQRHIDHAQPASGLRASIAIGDLQLVSLRPFSRTHMGAISDSINLASRLQKVASPNEIVVSNSFHSRLAPAVQVHFEEMEPVLAHNLGPVKAWRRAAASGPLS